MTASDAVTTALALGALAFLAGSIPFGLLVARLFNVKDLRTQGSGNIGATNVSRVAGWRAGAATLALDAIKGLVPVLLAGPSGRRLGLGVFGVEIPELSETVIWAIGLCAVLGHCYSPWLRFNGGKGVATGFGAILPLAPVGAAAGILAFALAFLATKIGSLASLSGLLAVAVVHLVYHPPGPHLAIGAILVAVIVWRHEGNIRRLLEGAENRF